MAKATTLTDLLSIAIDGTNRALSPKATKLTEALMDSRRADKVKEEVGRTFDAACQDVVARIAALVISKQHDYGQQNIKMGRGLLGIAIRIGDKVARLQNLVFEGKEPKHETLVDTLMDIAGYAVVGLMWDAGTFELPLEKEH